MLMELFCLASGEETPITVFQLDLTEGSPKSCSGSEELASPSGWDLNYDFKTGGSENKTNFNHLKNNELLCNHHVL